MICACQITVKHAHEQAQTRPHSSNRAVGQFYERFYPVEDEDMIRILTEEQQKAT